MGRAKQSAASTPRRTTRSRAGRADTAAAPVSTPAPALDPSAPTPADPTPSTSAVEAPSQADILGVILAAEDAAAAYAVSPMGDNVEVAPKDPEEQSTHTEGFPLDPQNSLLSNPTESSPSHVQSSPPPIHSSPLSPIHVDLPQPIHVLQQRGPQALAGMGAGVGSHDGA